MAEDKYIYVLAAGSLRPVWPSLMAAFKTQSPATKIITAFGPAGLLRERIEQGEKCDLFASANRAHPQKLLLLGKALGVTIFTHNKLCLTLPAALAQRDWLSLLADPALRIGTSTPLSDPSGDYTWQLFDRIEKQHQGLGEDLKRRALKLVGGADSLPVPPGELAATWLLKTGQADIFIGYQSYASLMAARADFVTLPVPSPYQVRADYAFALCHHAAQPLGDFLCSAEAREIFLEAGFSHDKAVSGLRDDEL
uniref:substrate-binding domain-containing protein n=1 Tax=Pantoea sp. IMH TaxID=1267600 RepID=UPI0004B81887|nr:substrate-binding domain-containing protein [Pantoea sp. IMH]